MANYENNEMSQMRQEPQSPPAAPIKADQGFIQHESPMSYEATKQPVVSEAGPMLVTPLERLGANPANVDCPFCKKVTKTEVRSVGSGDDGMTQCLICLVCWPMLFCYEGNKDTNQYCTSCKRQLTTKPHGTGIVQVVAEPTPRANLVPSKFEQSSYAQNAS